MSLFVFPKLQNTAFNAFDTFCGITHTADCLAQENVGRSVNAMEFTSRSPLVHYFVDTFCQDNSAFVEVCFEVFEEVSGKSKRERRIPVSPHCSPTRHSHPLLLGSIKLSFWQDLLPTISAYHPAGTSYRAMEHVGALSSASESTSRRRRLAP